VQNILVL